MSEFHPVYIPCAAGANSQTDCLVRRHGDLVEILGHPSMHLIAEDAKSLAGAIWCAAGKDDAGSDVDFATLRSRIAMALHAPDAPARDLLDAAAEALRKAESELRHARWWAKRWQDLYEQEKALSEAEIDDGK